MPPKGRLRGVSKVLSCRECRLLEYRLLMSLCTDDAVSHGLRRPSVSAAIQWRPLQMDFTDHCTIARCSHILSAAMWEGGCSQTMLSTLFSYLVSRRVGAGGCSQSLSASPSLEIVATFMELFANSRIFCHQQKQ